jgi:hypothetical protein
VQRKVKDLVSNNPFWALKRALFGTGGTLERLMTIMGIVILLQAKKRKATTETEDYRAMNCRLAEQKQSWR